MADRTDSLGFDLKCGADIEPSGREASGADLVADAILHMLTTDEKLPLIDAPDDEVEGFVDVRKWVGEAITREQLEARAAGLGPVLERDKRIASTEVTATLDSTRGNGLWSFSLNISATLRTGETIDRVLSVDGVSVEFLAGR